MFKYKGISDKDITFVGSDEYPFNQEKVPSRLGNYVAKSPKQKRNKSPNERKSQSILPTKTSKAFAD